MHKSFKTIFISLIVASAIFTSCKKEYTCTCTYAEIYQGLTHFEDGTESFEIEKSTEDVAERKCSDIAMFSPDYSKCELN